MRIDFNQASLPLIAAIVAGCTGLADPDDRSGTPTDEGESMSPPAGGSGGSSGSGGAGGNAGTGGNAGSGGASVDPAVPPPSPAACEWAGQTFADGTAIPSGDSCNFCGCYDGDVVCTERVCEGPVGASCEVAGQSFLDGSEVPSGDTCNTCSCADGVATCTEIACDAVSCDLFVEVADEVCSRFLLDPCIFQDPDCGSGATFCEAAGQTFADGADVPSGDDCNTCRCDAGSVSCTAEACEVVFCAEFVEEPDGLCTRFPLDPCIAQDPDCAGAPEATQ